MHKLGAMLVNRQIVKYFMIRRDKQTNQPLNPPHQGSQYTLWVIPTVSHHGQILKHWGQEQSIGPDACPLNKLEELWDLNQ